MKKIYLAILVVILFAASGGNLFAQLSGTYTINSKLKASATNYKDFYSAVGDMLRASRNDGGPVNGFSVSGPVVFNVADTTYNESVQIGQIFGASATNTITFQSASGDKDKVILNGNNGSTVYLNGADFVTFKQMTLQNDNYRVVELDNVANYNTITSCILKSSIRDNGNYQDDYVGIYSSPYSSDSNNVFTNNTILNGAMGIKVYGQNGGLETGTVIENNTFHNQYYGAIYANYQNGLRINANTITTHSNDFDGINTSVCDSGTVITNNRISSGGGSGISLYGNISSAMRPALIANNFVNGALNLGGSTFQNIYNNNVFVTFGDALNVQSNGSNINIKNNIFVNQSGRPAYLINGDGSNISSADYNDMFSSGDFVASFNGYDVNLADLKTASSKDANSVSINPYFTSSFNLHPNAIALDNLAGSEILVAKDIDGTTRGATHDIGAQEFTGLVTLDASVSNVLPSSIPCGGITDAPVSVTFGNAASTTLTSAKINWKANGVLQTAVNWTGTLAAGENTTIALGIHTFVNSSAKITVWLSNVNNAIDINASNDTARVMSNDGFAGIYTIGGLTPDYTKISDAINDLYNAGVCGAVTFNIRKGDYNEQLRFNDNIPNSGTNQRITFQSETGDSTDVRIHYNSTDNYQGVVQIDWASYITFKNLTIEQTSVNNGNAVYINQPTQIIFSNNIVKSPILQGQTWDERSTIWATNGNYNGTEFSHNRIEGGSCGLRLDADQDQDQGSVKVNYNKFANNAYHNLYVKYHRNPEIIGNSFTSGANTYGDSHAIHIQECYNGGNVSKNNIIGNNYRTGIYFQYTSNAWVISNNMIALGGTNQVDGINIDYNNQSTKVYNNSINITSTHTENTALRFGYYGSSKEVKNNIFSSDNGYSVYYYCSDVSNSNSDNNNFYNKNAQSKFRTYNPCNGPYQSLQDWRNSGHSWDANSVNVDPLFVSATDLHVAKNISLNNAGTIATQGVVAEDFDGEVRDADHHDIGADEFYFPSVNAGISKIDSVNAVCGVTTNHIHASLVNSGIDTLFTSTVKWSVNGVAKPDVLFNDTLKAGEVADLFLGDVTYTQNVNNIKVWSSLPNGKADEVNLDDTIKVAGFRPLSGILTIGGTSPDFKNFTEATNNLNAAGICGPVTFNVRNGIYSEQIVLHNVDSSSATNKITFKAESTDSNAVVLRFSPIDYNYNYTLSLDNVDHIEFNHITFESKDQNNGSTVVNFDRTDYLTFSNCVFRGDGDNIVASEDNNDENYVTFKNNRFEHGYYAMYFYGNESCSHTVIENNSIENCDNGFDLEYHNSPVISNNVIHTYGDGLYLYSVNDSLKLVNNRIQNDYGTGINLQNCQSSVLARGLIANNLISVSGNNDNNNYGFNFSYTYKQNVYNNTVRVSGSDNSAAFKFNYSNNGNRILNNVFANFGTGNALYSDYAIQDMVDSMDNNAYYTNGAMLFNVNNLNYKSLALWNKFNPTVDSSSVNANPVFTSALNLHVNSPALNNSALPLALVKKDIDGQVRTSTPDMGALEFTPILLNAGITETGIENFQCAGTYDVLAILNNYGTNTLTSEVIKWSVNGVAQTPFNFTGSLAQGASDTIVIGKYVYAPLTYTPLNLKVWTSAPNADVDMNHFDDTTRNVMQPALFGTFKIGKSQGSDFSSINQAVDLLNNNTICGPVVFNIENGIYNDGEVNLYQIRGASELSRVTFQSASGDSSKVIITNNENDNYRSAFRLYGADFVTFKQLTFDIKGNYNHAVELSDAANDNTFVGNVFKNIETTQDHNYISGIYNNGNDNNNTIVRNNRFVNGSYGIYWRGNNAAAGTVVDGNKFDNQYRYGVYSRYMDDFNVTNNSFKNKNTASSNYYALSSQDGKGDLNVINNKFNLHQGYSAIYPRYISANVVIKNNVMTLDSSSNNYTYLIDAEYLDNVEIVDNTFISHSTSNAYGMYVYDIQGGLIQNNTINVDVDGNAYGMDLETIKRTDVRSNHIRVNSKNFAEGIYIDEFTNAQLFGNTMKVTSGTNDAYGMEIYGASKSKFYGDSISVASEKSSAYGIYTSYDAKSNYYDNTVKVSTMGTDNQSAYGLYFTGCGSTMFNQNSVDVNSTQRAYGMYADNDEDDNISVSAQNNFVSTKGNTVATGAYFYAATSFNLNNNNFNVYGASSNYSTVVELSYAYDFKMMNNVLTNNAGGFVVSDYGQYISQSTNNAYFTTGDLFGYWNESDVNTFADWKTVTGFDANSIEANPMYHSATDLHVCNNVLDAAGTVLKNLTIDFDGEKRSTSTPDIGADEFTANPYVLSLGSDFTFCSTSILNAGVLQNAHYMWSNSATTQSIDITATGTYSVTVSDGACISETASVIATKSLVSSSTVVNLGADLAYCVSHVLDAGNPGSKYQWSNGATTQTINADQSGSYSVIVKDDICSVSDQINLDIRSLPVVTLGADVTVCGGKALDAGNAGMNYVWSTGATTQTIIAGLTNTYSVQVSDALGCSSSDAVNITNQVQSVDLGNDVTLCGPSLLSAGNPGSTYLWTTGATTQTITVSATGNYGVTVSGTAGCVVSDNILIIIDAKAPHTVDLGLDKTLCVGNTATLDAGTGVSYTWTNGATTQSIVVSSTSIYGVAVTKAAGCVDSDQILVVFDACAGVNESGSEFGINVYPNPSNDNFNLSFNIPNSNDVTVKVMNVTGQLVYADNLKNYSGAYTKKINLSNQTSGIYFLQISIGDKQMNRKLILNN